MVGLKLFTSIDRFEIMAIPFFILAGNFSRRRCSAAHDRLRDLDDRALVWRPRARGVVACALFAAISGSSVATVVGIGSIILPAIVQNGYPPRSAPA